MRELSRMPSNFRSENTIQNFLKKNEVPGIAAAVIVVLVIVKPF